MIISHSLRQQTALLAGRFHPIKPPHLPQIQRQLHSVPPLTHDAYLQKNGVPGVFSRAGFNRAWTRYQGYLVHRLNQLTEGDKNENAKVQDLLLNCAREARMAPLFNYASMAYNNHFFFKTICPEKKPIPVVLAESIDASFSSLDSFRSTFIATADAMFGPGYVWLVKQNSGPTPSPGNLAILNTYIAGSPLPGAHYRKQPIDYNTVTTNVTKQMNPSAYLKLRELQTSVGSFGEYSSNAAQRAPGGVDVEVLLCVSTWEHSWMFDHGVDGKRRFLEEWWEKIDWDVVSQNTIWRHKPRSIYQREERHG